MEPGRRKKRAKCRLFATAYAAQWEKPRAVRENAGHDRLADGPPSQHIPPIGSQPSVNGLEQAEVNGPIGLKRPVGWPQAGSPAEQFFCSDNANLPFAFD